MKGRVELSRSLLSALVGVTLVLSASFFSLGGVGVASAQSVSTNPPTAIGQSVVTTDVLNVRTGPNTSYALVGTEQMGSSGMVIGGPETGGGFTWWEVNYTDGLQGWSAQNWLSVQASTGGGGTGGTGGSNPSPVAGCDPASGVLQICSPAAGTSVTGTFTMTSVLGGTAVPRILVDIDGNHLLTCYNTNVCTATIDSTLWQLGTTHALDVTAAVGTNVTEDTITVINGNTSVSSQAGVQPSETFTVGQQVEADGTINVRDAADGNILGQEASGNLGSIIGGPTNASSNTWWDINWADQQSGWSAESVLEPGPAAATTSVVTISQLAPSSGPVGTAVTITGTGFSPTGNTVNFDGATVSAGNISSSDGGTSLVFTVPGSFGPTCNTIVGMACSNLVGTFLPGPYPLTVTNASNTVSNSLTFTIGSSSSVPVGGGTGGGTGGGSGGGTGGGGSNPCQSASGNACSGSSTQIFIHQTTSLLNGSVGQPLGPQPAGVEIIPLINILSNGNQGPPIMVSQQLASSPEFLLTEYIPSGSTTTLAANTAEFASLSVTAGSLPPGLSLLPDPVSCPAAATIAAGKTAPPCIQENTMWYLSGLPTTAGTYNFTLTATDSNGAQGSASFQAVIGNQGAKINLQTPAGNQGYTIGGTGGTGSMDIIWSSTGFAASSSIDIALVGGCGNDCGSGGVAGSSSELLIASQVPVSQDYYFWNIPTGLPAGFYVLQLSCDASNPAGSNSCTTQSRQLTLTLPQ